MPRYLEWLLRQTEDPPAALATGTTAVKGQGDSAQVGRGQTQQTVRLLGGGMVDLLQFARAAGAASGVDLKKIFM
jgi:hypothetical protein